MSSMTKLGWRLIVRGDAESELIEGLFYEVGLRQARATSF
jgi:hypothetical protein